MAFLRSVTFLILLFSGAMVASAQVRDALNDEQLKIAMDTVVQPQIDSGLLVGVIVGITQNGHHLVWSYGKLHIDSPGALDANNVFNIASVTKTFTGTALASLVNDGTVTLDQNVSSLITELRGTAADTITLRQLATHTSGLPRVDEHMFDWPYDQTNPYKFYDLSRLISFFRSYISSGPEAISYSNLGVGTLGLALSRANHSTYEKMIHDRILTPLGLEDTAVTLSDDQNARLITGYAPKTHEVVPVWTYTPETLGLGSVDSTLNDLLTYVEANLNPTSTDIGRSITLTHQIQVSGNPDSIGLNWFIQNSSNLLHHNGLGWSSTDVWMDLQNKKGVIILSNTTAPVQCASSVAFGYPCTLH